MRQPQDPTPRPPTLIEDAVFVNPDTDHPEISDITDVFDKWGATVLLVDFFAYSCTNCIRTIPHLKELYARYRPHGLEILAFAHPEFAFEGQPDNIRDWMARNDVTYPVFTDNDGTNWKQWGVLGWPTHFLIIKDKRSQYQGKLVTSLTHVGDRDNHEVYNAVSKLLKMEEPPQAPMDHEPFVDVEVFLGTGHRSKNVGGKGCSSQTGACAIMELSDSHPAEDLGMPVPASGRTTLYGARWCGYCRKAKALLSLQKESFDFVDVDDFGGAPAVLRRLHSDRSVPTEHRTLPMVFVGKDFVGGYSQLLLQYPDVDDEGLEKELQIATSAGDAIRNKVGEDGGEQETQAITVAYDKNGNKVSITFSGGEDSWVEETEAMTATEDALVTLRADLPGAAASEFFAYLVCEPSPGGGWIKLKRNATGAEAGSPRQPLEQFGKEIQVNFPGRHYLRKWVPSSLGEVRQTLMVSRGMRVYVLWLSTEPHSAIAAA